MIAFTETNLNDRICDNDILPKDFQIYRKDRSKNGDGKNVCGGGVLIAIKKRRNFATERITHTNSNELFDGLEVVCLKLTVINTIVCLYIPSGSNTHTYNLYCKAMNRLKCIVGQNTLIVMGDFNLPNLEWNIKKGASIMRRKRKKSSNNAEIVDLFVEDEFWHPYRKGKGKFLDLVLTNGGKTNVALGSPYKKYILVSHEENHQPLIIIYNTTAIQANNDKHRKLDKHFTIHISGKSNRKELVESSQSLDESELLTRNSKRAKTSNVVPS